MNATATAFLSRIQNISIFFLLTKLISDYKIRPMIVDMINRTINIFIYILLYQRATKQ